MRIQAYRSRVSDSRSRRLGTFSYLQPLTAEQVRAQLDFAVESGLVCAVEHVEPERAPSRLWYLWKLPMFGTTDVDAVLAEIDECHRANPRDHVRVVGYDTKRQTMGMSFVVHRA